MYQGDVTNSRFFCFFLDRYTPDEKMRARRFLRTCGGWGAIRVQGFAVRRMRSALTRAHEKRAPEWGAL